MRLESALLALERVKAAVGLLEGIAYSGNASKALVELRLVQGALEFEVNRLTEKEGGVGNGVE